MGLILVTVIELIFSISGSESCGFKHVYLMDIRGVEVHRG